MNANDRIADLLRAWEPSLSVISNVAYNLATFEGYAVFGPALPADLRELTTVLDEIADLLDPVEDQ